MIQVSGYIFEIDYDQLSNYLKEQGFGEKGFGKLVLVAMKLPERLLNSGIMAFSGAIEKIAHQKAAEFGVVLREVDIVKVLHGGQYMMKVELNIQSIDYHELVAKVLPMVEKSMESNENTAKIYEVIKKVDHMPEKMILGALDSLNDKEKEVIIAGIASLYRTEAANALLEFGVHINPDDISISSESQDRLEFLQDTNYHNM